MKRKHDFDNYEFIELFSNDTKPITAEDLSFLLDKESEEIDPDFKLEEFGTDELGIKKLFGSETLINTFKDSIKCPYCIKFKTHYNYDLSLHIQKKHPIKSLKCDKCLYVTGLQEILNNHKKIHEKTNKQKIHEIDENERPYDRPYQKRRKR